MNDTEFTPELLGHIHALSRYIREKGLSEIIISSRGAAFRRDILNAFSRSDRIPRGTWVFQILVIIWMVLVIIGSFFVMAQFFLANIASGDLGWVSIIFSVPWVVLSRVAAAVFTQGRRAAVGSDPENLGLTTVLVFGLAVIVDSRNATILFASTGLLCLFALAWPPAQRAVARFWEQFGSRGRIKGEGK